MVVARSMSREVGVGMLLLTIILSHGNPNAASSIPPFTR